MATTIDIGRLARLLAEDLGGQVEDFKPTPAWMAKKYDEFNRELFGGSLGRCRLEIFTTGKGSEGGWLGFFSAGATNIKANAYTRRMYVVDGWRQVSMDRNNFARLFDPVIKLNGNYSGAESGFETTLVHEMCHYANYMDGYAPRQPHGTEFKQEAARVGRVSNGRFTIERLLKAEEAGLHLDKAVQDKIDARKRRAVSKSVLVLVVQDGVHRLSLCATPTLAAQILLTSVDRPNCTKGYASNDQSVLDLVYDAGYKKPFRTWRFWRIDGKPILDELMKRVGNGLNVSFDKTKGDGQQGIAEGAETSFDIPAGVNLGIEAPDE